MSPSLILLLGTVMCATAALAATEETAAQSPRVLVIGRDGTASHTLPDNATGQSEPAAPRSIEDIVAATEPAATPAVVTPPAADLAPIVQAMQLMIDQQKLALQSMEESRKDALETNRRSSEVLERKMAAMEDGLAAQRNHESATLDRMNRLIVGVAAGFAGTGFVVMVLTGWFFMRTMNKIAEINAQLQSQLLALPQTHVPLVGEGSGNPPGNQRLLGALEQLERRIRELEHTSASTPIARPEAPLRPPAPATGAASQGAPNLLDLDEPSDESESPSTATLMAKGQTLLNLDDAEEALECFDLVLKRDPHNADALLKRGTALERLRRMQEALDAYDAAIQQDDSLTMAYLAKGGICNRLERYSEALECYEHALRAQQQQSAA